MAKRPRSIYVVNGPKIRMLRDRAGYTLTRFAQTLGADVSQMSRIERGKEQPGIELRNRIAAELKVSMDEIASLRGEATQVA